MNHLNKATVAMIVTMAFAAALFQPCLAADTEQHGRLSLSPELSALLKAEMGALSEGVGVIALALAEADWGILEETSEKMYESYIMKQSLTPSLADELRKKLPQDFKQLDAAFHARALKLQNAARARDIELAGFHYSKLVESCGGCHSAYAAERFPGFKASPQKLHQH